jgi:hypothetical protein
VAALRREVSEIRATLRPRRGPYISPSPNNPLEGHRLLSKKLLPDEVAEHEPWMLKSLGLENAPLISAEMLRQ